MHRLKGEVAAYLAAKDNRTIESSQIAALQIACHIDLSMALESDAATRARIVVDLRRKIERERLRGTRGHWSYDINRHIALKQALERLTLPEDPLRYFAGKKKFNRCRAFPNKKAAPTDAASLFYNKTEKALLNVNASFGPSPSSSQVASGLPHNWARPSDSSDRGPTSHDTARGSARSASSGGASAT